MLVFGLVCVTLCLCGFCINLDEEDRAGCFAFLSFGGLVTVYVLQLFLMVSWVGLQFVMGYFLIVLTFFLVWRYNYIQELINV